MLFELLAVSNRSRENTQFGSRAIENEFLRGHLLAVTIGPAILRDPSRLNSS